jgi:hypothetical protein
MYNIMLLLCCLLEMQVLTQVAVAPAAAAGSAAGIFDVLALAVFPVYLDIKVSDGITVY